MDNDGVARAVAAATSVAVGLGLAVEDVSILQNSNKLALRLLPCDVFARIAPLGEEVAALEVEMARNLVVAKAPVATLDGRVEPLVYRHDGFAITFWTYYEQRTPEPLSPSDYALALQCLHGAMRTINATTQHFTERVEEAQRLVENRNWTPGLDDAGRKLLLDTLISARRTIERSGAAEQLLHGEPHPGNILNTTSGPLFIDLETCCRGPVEFDLAHVPGDVSQLYAGADDILLAECRRLVLAMVAAWRWDAHDEFPNGRHHAYEILALLGNGPPWPALGELKSPRTR